MTSMGGVDCLKKLIPLLNSSHILNLCLRNGLLAERPSVCRRLGWAVGRRNAPFSGPVNRTSNVTAWFEGKGPGL
ncbi:hypothetical protein PsAD26_05606 [Pseudovibrio sp. Ad26]|nr:hypothetical protein PsAD26_05606 [Pseudovibrio sp. Ad26]